MSKFVSLFIIIAVSGGCAQSQSNSEAQSNTSSGAPRDKLFGLVEKYWKEDKTETIFECQGENSISVTSTGKFRYSKDRDGSDLFVPEVSIKSKALSDAVLSGEPRNVNTAPINHTLPKGTTLNFSGFFDRLDPNFFGAINLSFKDKRASTEISLDKKLFYWNSIDLNLEKMTASVYLSTAVQDDGEDGMMHFAWKGFKSCTQEKNKFLYLLECLTADKAQRDFGRACKEKKF